MPSEFEFKFQTQIFFFSNPKVLIEWLEEKKNNQKCDLHFRNSNSNSGGVDIGPRVRLHAPFDILFTRFGEHAFLIHCVLLLLFDTPCTLLAIQSFASSVCCAWNTFKREEACLCCLFLFCFFIPENNKKIFSLSNRRGLGMVCAEMQEVAECLQSG